MRVPSEHQEQVRVVEWCRDHGLLVMSIPNGANLHPRERSKLMAEGLCKGAADLLLLTPPPAAPGVHMVGVEMKRRAGGVLSPAQRDWIASVADMPWWRVLVCAGARDAVEQLRALGYGQGKE